MKKIIFALAAASLIATPAAAGHRDHGKHERRGNGCGWLCGAIIGGIVVGAISSSKEEERKRYEREYDNRYYPPNYRYDQRYCVREQIVEWHYGERYVYWQTTCN